MTKDYSVESSATNVSAAAGQAARERTDQMEIEDLIDQWCAAVRRRD